MKLFRAYAVTAIICLSLTSIISCIFIVDENAEKISLGNESAVVVLSSSDEKYYKDAINPVPAIVEITEIAEKVISISPPPLSNLYWFFINLI